MSVKKVSAKKIKLSLLMSDLPVLTSALYRSSVSKIDYISTLMDSHKLLISCGRGISLSDFDLEVHNICSVVRARVSLSPSPFEQELNLFNEKFWASPAQLPIPF